MSGFKKILILSIFIALAILTIIVLRIVYLIVLVECQLLVEEPVVVVAHKNVGSQDNLALVNFVGFLVIKSVSGRWENFNVKYLPLDLRQVHYTVDEVDQVYQLQLDVGCAQITMEILLIEKDKYVVADMFVDSKSSYAPFKQCHVPALSLSSYSYEHYQCDRRKVYGCWEVPLEGSRASRIVSVELELRRFEFEVNGNPQLIEKGQFSKLAAAC